MAKGLALMDFYLDNLDLSPYFLGHSALHFRFSAFDPALSEAFACLLFRESRPPFSLFMFGANAYGVKQVIATRISLISAPQDPSGKCYSLIFSDSRAHLLTMRQQGDKTAQAWYVPESWYINWRKYS